MSMAPGHPPVYSTQPFGFTTRVVDAGCFLRCAAGRMGRSEKLPPQLGHTPFNTPSTHALQKVHSNVQIMALADSGGKSVSQHSQFGRSSSIKRALLAIRFGSDQLAWFVHRLHESIRRVSLSWLPMAMTEHPRPNFLLRLIQSLCILAWGPKPGEAPRRNSML